ncbi:sensor domain-containing diguanylate cyclase [Ectobacillus sp. JY-23]|uniref:sensor domain-containing diguanylate cyclase n=1 Tax=Ectobacillus sp. JY-23 TaxID=2933872 RepID=UPI001FF57360|nr:sensor domain-containing diguanylate cyclase [Ectobacillus sp. JY-23]UOY91747.1 sensor domain-containing diguanylate cyclase [Ectobacillus sp. JY-23]
MTDVRGDLDTLQIVSSWIESLSRPENMYVVEHVTKEAVHAIKNDAVKETLNVISSQVQNIAEQMDNMRWLVKHYRILHEFAQTCTKTLSEDDLMQKAYEMVSQVMPTDSFYIALYNEGDAFIHFPLLMDNDKRYPRDVTEFGENYTSNVIRARKIVHLQEITEPEEGDASFGENETRSGIFVPIIINDEIKGVISAQSYANYAYRKEHEELLQIIGMQVFSSIETARLYKKIYTMSQTDELTGLKNHRAFHEDLSRYMEEPTKGIAIVMIDSDNLKKVNDTYGHDIGDLYLKVLAKGIQSINCDCIDGYRYAGDEFMLIIRNHEKEHIKEAYQRLKVYYQQHPIEIEMEKVEVSISAGVAYYPLHGSSVDLLKKSADTALYLAKKNGGNQLYVAM